MAALKDADYIKISTEGGANIIDAYYNALNSSRSSIKSFYVPTTGANTDKGLPFINYNGEVIQDADELQQEYEHSGFTYFDAQAIDVHVLNPTMGDTTSTSKTTEAERNMSMVVQVSGSVRIDERQSGPLKGFSESFVLVPNTEAAGTSKTKQSEGRKWLIQSQQFRFVVEHE